MDCKNCMFSICWQPSGEYRVTAFIDDIKNFSDSINSMKISNNADLDGETSSDVAGVCILEYKELKKIPNNLKVFFPNMIALEISRCGLDEISRFELENLKNLREIKLSQMEIEILPGNLFEDLKNLEIIELQKNKINFIEKETFKGLPKLKYVDLRKNPKINAIFATNDFEIDEDLNVTRLLRVEELNGLIQIYFHSEFGGNLTNVKDILMTSEDSEEGRLVKEEPNKSSSNSRIKSEGEEVTSTLTSSSERKISLTFSLRDEINLGEAGPTKRVADQAGAIPKFENYTKIIPKVEDQAESDLKISHHAGPTVNTSGEPEPILKNLDSTGSDLITLGQLGDTLRNINQAKLSSIQPEKSSRKNFNDAGSTSTLAWSILNQPEMSSKLNLNQAGSTSTPAESTLSQPKSYKTLYPALPSLSTSTTTTSTEADINSNILGPAQNQMASTSRLLNETSSSSNLNYPDNVLSPVNFHETSSDFKINSIPLKTLNSNDLSSSCEEDELKSWVEIKSSEVEGPSRGSQNSPNEVSSNFDSDERKIKNFNESVKIKSEFDCSQSICRDIQCLLKSDDFRDFTVFVSDTKFRVHKFILTARSPILAEMIKNNPDADDLCLHNMGVDIFEIILDYIYNNKMPQKIDGHSAKVFAAAGKLKLEGLKNQVGKLLCGIVEHENCVDLLTLGKFYNHEELKEKALSEVKKFHEKKK